MSVFSTVVCGVDGSPEGDVAAQVAARVTEPDGDLVLVSVEDTSVAAYAGYGAGNVLEAIDADARKALEKGRTAAAAVHPATTSLRTGNPVNGVKQELAEREATLAVVGMRHRSRAKGIAVGSVSTFLLHEAPCSVLVARTPEDLERWPRAIVVGLDGSDESAAALLAARTLAERFGSTVRTVVAVDGDVDVVSARLSDRGVDEHEGRPTDVLHVLSEHSDLVVVGSRGLRGVRALGSVSERVAHDALCSVLVVRGRGAPDPYRAARRNEP